MNVRSKNRYINAGSYYLIGNLFNKGIVFLTIPIFTRLLSTYDYGIVNTYMSWVVIAVIILGMTFTNGIRAAFNDFEENIDDFVSSITFLSIITATCISVLTIISIFIFKLDISIVITLLCLIQGFSLAMVGNYSMYLMMKFEYKKRTLLLILPNLLSTILSIVVIYFFLENSLYFGRIISTFLVTSIFGLIVLVLIFRQSRKLINREYWKYALAISLPIIIHGLSLSILSQSDRIMITSLADASQTGIYSLIYNFSMVSLVVSASLEGVWVPWFIKKVKNKSYKEINEKVLPYIDIMTISSIGIILISPELLKLMAPSEYWEGTKIIPPIVLSSFVIFIYTIYVNIEHFHKKTKQIAVNTIIAAFVNILLNLLLIPKFGYVAAAFTTLISYLVALVLHYRNARILEPSLFPIKNVVKTFLLLIISMFIFYIFIEDMFIRWFSVFIIIGIVLFKYKNEIKLLLKGVHTRKIN